MLDSGSSSRTVFGPRVGARDERLAALPAEDRAVGVQRPAAAACAPQAAACSSRTDAQPLPAGSRSPVGALPCGRRRPFEVITACHLDTRPPRSHCASANAVASSSRRATSSLCRPVARRRSARPTLTALAARRLRHKRASGPSRRAGDRVRRGRNGISAACVRDGTPVITSEWTSSSARQRAYRRFDSQLGEVEHLLRLEQAAAAAAWPQLRGVVRPRRVFCWQCGESLVTRPTSRADSSGMRKPLSSMHRAARPPPALLRELWCTVGRSSATRAGASARAAAQARALQLHLGRRTGLLILRVAVRRRD